MNKFKIFWCSGIILAAAAGFFAGSAVFRHEQKIQKNWESDEIHPGDEFRHFKKPTHFEFKQKMDSALGLSKTQQIQLDSNGRTCDSLRREMKKSIRNAEMRLHDILEADSVSEADLLSVRAELLLLNEKRLDQRIADIRFFKSVLTHEQAEKFKSFGKKFEKMKKFSDKMPHPNDEPPPFPSERHHNGEGPLPPPPNSNFHHPEMD
ncbi:hypothetical protein [Hallerella porci]|uniref:Periplasmic heavy metal sensor n=1 Tax=Hallerella porci TaxID=1945871 RepID=A0ABX5LPA7_9BACT|nr:hypothetical protein [Hallerella porci]PWL04270.1 hypothetical protein B0H50_101285 [Hallerella porci]